MRIEWRQRPFFYAAILFCLAILVWRPLVRELPPTTGSVFLGGRIDSEVETREGKFGSRTTGFILKTERLWKGLDSPGEEIRNKVRVSWKNAPEDLRYGDKVVLEGELAPFKGAGNPGGFDARAYWQRQNVDGAFHVGKKARIKYFGRDQGNTLIAGSLRVKQALSKRLSSDFEKRQAAFLQALFLGEKRDLDQDFKDAFLKTGTMHIVAVSGFNIGFLTAILWFFLRPVPLPRNAKKLVLLAAVWGYCLLVGWQAPVVRASVMASIVLIGSLSGRKADGLNSLGLAALFLLAFNPWQLFDVGFQLSFLAVFGLVVFAPVFIPRPELLPHEQWTLREKARFYFQELFWVSFICTLVTLPVIIQNFYILTPYALLANLLVVPVSFLLFSFGTVYFMTCAWLPKALFFIPWVMSVLMKFMVSCLFFMEGLPGAVWISGRLEPLLAAFLFIGIFYFFLDKKIRSRAVRVAVLVLFCANIFAAQELWLQVHRKFEMTMLDVGQGDAIYFEFPQGGNMLVDAGSARFSDKGRWAVAPFLKSRGVRSLDAVVISHPQEDHIGGLKTTFEDFTVMNVFHAGKPYASHLWEDIQADIVREKAVTRLIGRGDRLEGYPGIGLEVLHPEKGAPPAKNINDDSSVLKVQYGETSLLLTGDIQGPAMRSLMDSGQDLKAGVLKVPHHGAKLTSEGVAFVAEVEPGYSLISSGARNPFGHPAPATLAVLKALPGNQVLRTDEKGAISLLSDAHRITLD